MQILSERSIGVRVRLNVSDMKSGRYEADSDMGRMAERVVRAGGTLCAIPLLLKDVEEAGGLSR